jgi:hypothetical protein
VFFDGGHVDRRQAGFEERHFCLHLCGGPASGGDLVAEAIGITEEKSDGLQKIYRKRNDSEA